MIFYCMKIIVKELKKNYNVSEESDLNIFWKFIWYFVWIIIFLYICFLFFANILLSFVSLEKENELFWWYSNYGFDINKEKTDKINIFVWKDFEYEILVIDSYEANAFALPWWIIAVTSSLLDEIKYENSLLFIIWHEIGHIENRDVFKKIISEVPLQIILSIVWISWNLDLSFVLSWTSSLHSKTVESKADYSWLEFLYNQRKDVWCAMYFFEKDSSISENILTLLSDHPMTNNRISRIKDVIKQKWYEESETCEFLKL